MKKKRRVPAKALAIGAVLGAASSADAANFTVTTNADSGAGSLRQAILDANGTPGADTITFSAAVSGSTITLSSGEMLVSDSVDIEGPGSANLTIDANDTSRVFYVYNPSATPIDVTISGLTLANGFSVVPGDPTASAGGAVSVIGENVSLDDVDIISSVAGGAGGGLSFLGIDSTSSYNEVSAVLSVQNSTISGNIAEHVDPGVPVDQGGCGGGIYAASIYNVLLDNVTLSNNVARCSGGGFAGIYFQDGGTVTIQSSVITGNSVNAVEGGSGGGISFVYGYSYGEVASVIDTTISGNDGGGYGGGIASVFLYGLDIQRTTISGNQAESGAGVASIYTVGTIENSTVAENTASLYGGGIYSVYSYLTVKETTISGNTAASDGPGIYAYEYSELDLVNSIVANNGPGADLVDDGTSSFDVSYSLIENPDVATVNDNGGNIFDDDPELGPLQDNGGPTFTMKPAATSPVIDLGDPAFTPPPATDQRGFDRVSGGRIDMGAVELNPGTLQFSVIAQNVNESAGTASVTVTRTGGIDGAASAQASVDGSSTATGGGDDYTFAGATVNFADNDATPQVFNIAITDDGAVEPSETIVVTLGTPVGASIGAPSTHTVTIVDDDVAPPSADVSIMKTLEPGPVTQGSNVTFTLAVMNEGPDAAANVVVTDALPPQLTFVSATPSTGSCDDGPVTITCNLGALGALDSETITIVATMSGSGTTTNTATVASDTADGDGTDNSDQVTFTILPAQFAAVPSLDPRMQILLAALVAAAALGMLKRM